MRLLVPIALSVLVVTAVLLVSPNFRPERGPDAIPYAGDFLHEWIGGYVIRAGDPARLYDREYTTALQHDPSLVGFEFRRDAYLPMVYPPFYYVLERRRVLPVVEPRGIARADDVAADPLV